MSNENQNNSNRNNSHQQNGEKLLDTGAALASTFPSGFQAIATAYGDYTKKSFEDTKSFVEKLSGVRSLDKAIEVQTEFAKTAYETFVSEFAEDRRAVRRSCQAVLQASGRFSREDDSDKLIGVIPRCQNKMPRSSRGIF